MSQVVGYVVTRCFQASSCAISSFCIHFAMFVLVFIFQGWVLSMNKAVSCSCPVWGTLSCRSQFWWNFILQNVWNYCSVVKLCLVVFLRFVYLFSYYPLYPPHKSVSIDYEQFMSYGMMPVAPHVLLLPSDLRVFTKVSCLCIHWFFALWIVFV